MDARMKRLRQTVVIVCGPDMTGKTEIARELSRRLGVAYFKASSEHHAFLNDPGKFINDIRYADPRLVDFVKQTGVSVVFDRGFPCEYAYATVLGRNTDLQAIQRIDEGYSSLDARVILCCRLEGYDGIFDDLDPERINPQTLQTLHDAYVEYVKTIKCKHLILAVDDENLDREISDILNFLHDDVN